MTEQQALRLALEALGWTDEWRPQGLKEEAITAIEAVLEAKDEPVAWLHRFIEGGISIGLKPLDLERHPERWEPLYTTPPQRKPLTFEQVEDCFPEGAIFAEDDGWLRVSAQTLHDIVRNVEAAHGIKGEA